MNQQKKRRQHRRQAKSTHMNTNAWTSLTRRKRDGNNRRVALVHPTESQGGNFGPHPESLLQRLVHDSVGEFLAPAITRDVPGDDWP